MNISKKDEGVYRCEGRVEVRGEIDFRDIFVIVNGKKVLCFYYCIISDSRKLKRISCDKKTIVIHF